VKLGDLILAEKEASKLVMKVIGSSHVAKPKWEVVGKACTPRKLVIGALRRAMERAWGLHTQFRDIRDNRFIVRVGSEGDWKHVMKNGPWNFDFNDVLM
jgi:hypothetical protein